jgi:hypothetical protein
MPGMRVNDHLNVLVMLFQCRLELAHVFGRRILILLAEQTEEGASAAMAYPPMVTALPVRKWCRVSMFVSFCVPG